MIPLLFAFLSGLLMGPLILAVVTYLWLAQVFEEVAASSDSD